MSESEKHPATDAGGLESDLIWGAEAIGEVIRRRPRQTVYMLEKGPLPAKKVGRLWVATRSSLERHFYGDGKVA
jgi:hypothetical protein